MSDVTNWIMVGIATLGPIGGFAIANQAAGKHTQRITDLENARNEDREANQRAIEELKGRVSAAETAAGAVKGLAQAVENMGREFALEVKHLVERVGLEMGHIRDQLTDLKEEVRARAPRRRRQGED